MNRRNFLKIISVLPFLGKDTPKKEVEIDRFWMQTYGPFYGPSDFYPDWESADSSFLLGIHSGTELLGEKASDHPIGTRIALPDGRTYTCYSTNASMTGLTIKGKGVYI